MRVLIVGAGAVGQVYGRALQKGGAEVHFWVKPKHAEAARAGFTMYPLNGSEKKIRFEGFGVVTTVEEVRGKAWDQLWLAVSGPALDGGWLDELVAATGDATLVCLQPGAESRERVVPLAGDRLVMGLIAMVAYQAPLPGEARFTEPGVAYWYPPGGSPFSGPDARVKPVVAALKAGGCPAKAHPDVVKQATIAGALLQMHVAALDAAGWSWKAARAGDYLSLGSRAWREAAAIGAHELGTSKPWWTNLVTPLASKIAMFLSQWVIPMDVPTYFAYHFTKVGDQTRANLDHWITAGKAAGLPVEGLTELRGRMKPEASFDHAKVAG